ncbi:MAG: hypothetical protein ACKV2T_05570 [Kofleriaceae bacterium]
MIRTSIGVAAIVAAGCAAPAIAPRSESSVAPSNPPPSRPVLPDLDAMFAVPTPSTPKTRCRSFPLPSGGSRGVIGGVKRVVYDFIEMPLGASVRGPRTNVRERRAARMTYSELHRPFARRATHITRCWKWFAATHPGRDTTLDVHLAIDVFGTTSELTIVNAPADADLAACVRDAFAAPLYVSGPRQNEQRTHVTLQFAREDQPPWKKPPARPVKIASEPVPSLGTTCVRVGEPIAARLYPLRVSDFDPSRVPPPLPGMGRRIANVPKLRIGCVSSTTMPKKTKLRAALTSNWGAYEACHAAARERMPDLDGKVYAKLLFDVHGAEPTLASVSGAGDTELHACLDRALEEIWLEPPTESSLIEANFTFVLSSDATPPNEHPSEHATDHAAWRARFGAATTPIAGCTVRHELARDRMAAAPWIDDARVRAAFAELARFVAALGSADAAACLALVDATLREYTEVTEGMHAVEAERLGATVDRLEAVLPLARVVSWGNDLRWMLALAYRKDPARFEQGTAMLEELSLEPALTDAIRTDDPPRPIDNTCAL